MSRIKADASQNKRAMLNTTIESETLASFKTYCKELGIPMNVFLESFMRQAVAGDFVLKISKGNKVELEIEED